MNAINALPVEQLRAYIRQLKPEMRDQLLAEFERAALRGSDAPGATFVLQELRKEVRGINIKLQRVGTPQRLFYTPLEPFLVDGDAEDESVVHIPRACLDPIWQWIVRDVMPAESEKYSEEISRVLIDNDTNAADQLVRAFQDRAAASIEEALAQANESERTRRRMLAQLGPANGFEHAQRVAHVIKGRDTLAFLATKLPAYIKDLTEPQLSSIKTLIDSTIREPRLFPYALLLLMGRLGQPWQLIRLAVKAAESDVVGRIGQTSYGIALPILVAEIEHKIADLAADLRRGLVTGSGILLKEIHDGVRTLRSEVDLSFDPTWGRRLAALRSEVSDVITGEIDTLPGRVRRMLRPRQANEGGASLDLSEVVEVQALLGFLETCRQYASELAVNEVTLRIHSEVQNYLNTRTPMLIEAVRAASAAEQKFLAMQIDAAARFAGKVFNPDYASLLSKAAEIASQAPARVAAQS